MSLPTLSSSIQLADSLTLINVIDTNYETFTVQPSSTLTDEPIAEFTADFTSTYIESLQDLQQSTSQTAIATTAVQLPQHIPVHPTLPPAQPPLYPLTDPALIRQGSTLLARLALSELQTRHLKVWKSSVMTFVFQYYKERGFVINTGSSSSGQLFDLEKRDSIEGEETSDTMKEYFYLNSPKSTKGNEASEQQEYKFSDLFTPEISEKLKYQKSIDWIQHITSENLIKAMPKKFSKLVLSEQQPSNEFVPGFIKHKSSKITDNMISYHEKIISYGDLIDIKLSVELVQGTQLVLLATSITFPQTDYLFDLVSERVKEDLEALKGV
ncbi:hypothetical protein WICPIJ_009627 [Wickerhamomyces pijperi]|uniref:Uncharacterized protein n=1 Tax=Wickerhamomyces pijperi TaxID=599730 RepID=A0A9P8PN53_WICPI|nr:hypothetical protein WICPIJ_009627 [Wickerhamomyces pijperi]